VSEAETQIKQHPISERSDNEIFYDEEIAPRLRELGKMCEEREMSLVADVEFSPGNTASTRYMQADAGFKMQLSYMASKAAGNDDALVLGIYKTMKKTSQIGVSIYFTLIDRWSNEETCMLCGK
jgi:hypothetical protein